MAEQTEIISMNVRGLHSMAEKRRKLFQWIHIHKAEIVMIQESHSIPSDVRLWKSEFQGDIFFSHGNSASRGVCILLKSRIKYEVHETRIDNDGRYIILDITINDCRCTLANVYGPNKDDPAFFINVINIMESLPNDNRIVAGDFNCILNPLIDKQGGQSNHSHVKARELLKTYMEETSMVDIWRHHHPWVKGFTYHTSGRIVVFTRIDFFLVSAGFVALCDNSDIVPGFQSDHSFIKLKLSLIDQQRGKGFFKLNCSLLQDQEYVEMINTTITETVRNNPDTEPQLLWDTIKLCVRGETIRYASKNKKIKKNLLLELEKKLDQAQIEYADHPTGDLDQQINNFKKNIDKLLTEATNAAILRSKAIWHEHGEKPTKYFFNLEKRNYNKKSIKRLKMPDGSIIDNKKDILAEQKAFYQKLYTHNITLQNDPLLLDEFFDIRTKVK